MTVMTERDSIPLSMDVFFALQKRIARNVLARQKPAGQMAIVSDERLGLSVKMNEKARDYGFLRKHAVSEIESALIILNALSARPAEKVALINRRSNSNFIPADPVCEADIPVHINNAAEAYKAMCLAIMEREYIRNHQDVYPNNHAHSFFPEKYEWLREQITEIVDQEKNAMIDELNPGQKPQPQLVV